MKNKIEIPDELAHLIEKREQSDRRVTSTKTQGAASQDAKTPVPKKSTERRKGGDRRNK